MSVSTHRESWQELLDPDRLRPKLLAAAIYMAVFEVVKRRVINLPRGFLADHYDASGPVTGDEFEREVASRHQSLFKASLLWFEDMGVISQADLDSFEQMRELRNRIAHDLMQKIESTSSMTEVASMTARITSLIDKIERWWILEVDVPTNPDFDDKTVHSDDVTPGTTMLIHILTTVAFGDSTESRQYLSAISKAGGHDRATAPSSGQ